MAMSIQKPKYIFVRMGLIAVLVGLFVWSYILFSQNYKRVELAQKMVVALADNKTELAREYADQLGIVQENMDRTENFLKDIRAENMKLKEKIKLLDQFKDMEKEIGRLKEENARIQGQMLVASVEEKQAAEKAGFLFNTIEKGKSLLRDFKDKIRGVKKRMHVLKKKEYQKKVAIQQEIDRKESLLGNNGFLVKDGQPMPVSMPDMRDVPDHAKIKVKFVK